MTQTQTSRWLHSRLRGMHLTRLRTLSAVVIGFLEATRLGITAIAGGMRSTTAVRHRIKRVDRFLGNDRFDSTVVMAALAREADALFGELVIALDWVELRGGFRAIVAAVCTGRGRALPIAWAVVHPRKFRLSQNSCEEGFLRLLSTILPDPDRTTIIADRGFGRAELLPVLKRLGFGYIIRVRGHVEVDSLNYSGLLEDYPLSKGGEADLGWVEYRQDGVARTRVVMKWARTAEEPSYLVTNLRKGARRVSRIYAGRMQEEESFRDMKSHRYGFALRYVKLSRAERYERLMAIWAVGMWLFFAQGAAAVKADLHLGLSSAPNGRRELSLVRIGRMLLKSAIGGPPTLLRILADYLGGKRWG